VRIRQYLVECQLVHRSVEDGGGLIDTVHGMVVQQAIEAQLLIPENVAVGGGRSGSVSFCPISGRIVRVPEPSRDGPGN
jgi:hypothetical protein